MSDPGATPSVKSAEMVEPRDDEKEVVELNGNGTTLITPACGSKGFCFYAVCALLVRAIISTQKLSSAPP